MKYRFVEITIAQRKEIASNDEFEDATKYGCSSNPMEITSTSYTFGNEIIATFLHYLFITDSQIKQ